MARKLDERQQEELAAFVDALGELGGFSSTAEWSRESGYDRSALSDLRNRNGAVDGYNLLRLIRAASARARLEPEHLALLAARVGDGADGHLDDAILGRLDELAGLVTEALKLLRDEARRRAPGEPRSPEAAST